MEELKIRNNVIPNSLAYFKFVKTIEEEIRSYWAIVTMCEFSQAYLNNYDNTSLAIIGGNKAPFSYIDIPKSDFLSFSKLAIENARENALLNFITAFEVYLNEIYERIIFLAPDKLDKSETKWETKEIIEGIIRNNFNKWFASKIASKTIRNKQHKDILQAICKLIPYDLSPIKDKIDLWNKYTYVRNSIIHNSRRVSYELNCIWTDKYPAVGERLNLVSQEIMHVQKLAFQIARFIEKPILKGVIKYADAMLLIREIFVREGIEDLSRLKKILHKNLSYNNLTDQSIKMSIAFQKRHNAQPTEEFDFSSIYSHLSLE